MIPLGGISENTQEVQVVDACVTTKRYVKAKTYVVNVYVTAKVEERLK